MIAILPIVFIKFPAKEASLLGESNNAEIEPAKLDTTLADSVMGVGREIRILQQLVKENMSDTDYRKLIRKLNRL